MNIETMIEIRKGQIQNAPQSLQVDAIVNCANPTLMGSDSNVDGAIHQAIDNENHEQGFFKKKIIQEWKDKIHTEKEKVIRCNRGETVITEGYGVCEYVIHAVGPESDRNNGKWNGIYSSSCVEKLVKCYQSIMEQVFQYQNIEKIAIPVISAGNYGFDFEYAFTIGLTSVYNILLEKKKETAELFEYIGLKKVYFIVPDEMGNYETACEVFKKYQKVFQKEHRAVARGAMKSQIEFFKEIRSYDTQKGSFAIAKFIREILMVLRIILGLWTYVKDLISKRDWVLRRQTVEIMTFIKMLIPVPLMLLYQGYAGNNVVKWLILIMLLYNLADTVTYLIALMFFADIQRPSANLSRSLIMLIVNYIEVELDVAAIYLVTQNFRHVAVSFNDAVNLAIGCEADNLCRWLKFGNTGIKFFFLTVVLSYFSSHMRQRKFRTY